MVSLGLIQVFWGVSGPRALGVYGPMSGNAGCIWAQERKFWMYIVLKVSCVWWYLVLGKATQNTQEFEADLNLHI